MEVFGQAVPIPFPFSLGVLAVGWWQIPRYDRDRCDPPHRKGEGLMAHQNHRNAPFDPGALDREGSDGSPDDVPADYGRRDVLLGVGGVDDPAGVGSFAPAVPAYGVPR